MIWITAAFATDAISFVLVDRYADGAENATPVDGADPQAWHGGDLAGVLEHLDDLRGGLWLSPVWAARTEPVGEWGAFHGYWTADLTEVDPRFGTSEQLVEIGQRTRAEDRELWLDLVLNHVGYETRLVEEHPDWFHGLGDIEDWGDAEESQTHDVHGLPDLDQDNPEVYAYLRDSALHWVKTVRPTGFRVDAVKHLPPGFLARLKADLRAADPELLFLGEVFEGDPAALAERQRQDELDRVFDFPLHYALKDAVCGGQPARLAEVLSQDVVYDDPSSLVTFLDNHDVARIRTVCGGELDAVARALAVLTMMRGSPSLTWGTDGGLEGAEEPANRGDMDFEVRPLKGLLDDLLAQREAHDALGQHAPTAILELSEDHVVLGRQGESEGAAIVLTGSKQRRFDPIALGRTCALSVLTGTEGFQPVEELVVPPGGVGLALCVGGVEIDLAARFAGVVDEVEVQLPAKRRIAGVGRLGGWDPEAGLDPENGVVTVSARVGEVLTYKELDGEGSFPEGANQTHLVADVDREYQHLIYVLGASLPEGASGRDLLDALEEQIVWLDGSGPIAHDDPRIPAEVWRPIGDLLGAHQISGRPIVWEQESMVGGQVVQVVYQPVRERILVRIGGPPHAVDPAPTDLWERIGATPEGAWTGEARDQVWGGFQLFDESELALFEGSAWRYLAQGEKRWEGAAVVWRWKAPHFRISGTPGAFEGPHWGDAMIGDPAAAWNLGMETVVHEAGHVVQGAAFVQATRRRATGEKGMRRCYREGYLLTQERYREISDGQLSPSEYGRRTWHEGWAEAFAFWKLHPAYLARTAPGLYAWFERGDHLALPPCLGAIR